MGPLVIYTLEQPSVVEFCGSDTKLYRFSILSSTSVAMQFEISWQYHIPLKQSRCGGAVDAKHAEINFQGCVTFMENRGGWVH